MVIKNKKVISLFILIMLFMLCVASYWYLTLRKPYFSLWTPQQNLETAVKELEKDQYIALVFGGNWCPECRRLSNDARKQPLKDFLDKHFKVVKVDINYWSRNMDFAEQYGNSIDNGIPTIVILNKNKQILNTTKGFELAKFLKKNDSLYIKFFKYIYENQHQK